MTPSVKRLRAESSVLVVIDVQDKLLVKIPTAASLVRNAGFLLDVAALLDVPVRATEQYPKGLGPTTAELARRLPRSAAGEDRVQLLRRGDVPRRTRNAPPAERRAGRDGNARLRRADRARPARTRGCTSSSRSTRSRPAAPIDHDTALRRLEQAGAVPDHGGGGRVRVGRRRRSTRSSRRSVKLVIAQESRRRRAKPELSDRPLFPAPGSLSDTDS